VILNLGSHELIVGKIVESHISEECLTNDCPDPAKVKPLLFFGRGCCTAGECLGDAFHCGIVINQSAKLDTLDEIKKFTEAQNQEEKS
jgi:hypothetical protein